MAAEGANLILLAQREGALKEVAQWFPVQSYRH